MVSKKKIKPGQQVNDELENGIKVEQGLMIYELFFSGRCFRVCQQPCVLRKYFITLLSQHLKC